MSDQETVEIGRTRVDVADVRTATHRYYKSKVDLRPIGEQPGRVQLQLNNRRGQTLRSESGVVVSTSDGVVVFQVDDSDEQITIERLSKCGCGGTQITEL